MFEKENFVVEAAAIFPPQTAVALLREYDRSTIYVTDKVSNVDTVDPAGLVQNLIRFSQELDNTQHPLMGVDRYVLNKVDRKSIKALLAEGKRLGNCTIPGSDPINCRELLVILSALDPSEAYDVAVGIVENDEHWIFPNSVLPKDSRNTFNDTATGSAMLTLVRLCLEGKLGTSDVDLENLNFDVFVRTALESGMGLGFTETEIEEDLWCLYEMLKLTGKKLLPMDTGQYTEATDIPFVVFLNELAAKEDVKSSLIESFARKLIKEIPGEERYPLDVRVADSRLPRRVKRLLGREGLLQQTSSAAKALIESEKVLNGIYKDPALAAELPELPAVLVTVGEAREAIANHIADLSQKGPIPNVLRSWINLTYRDEFNTPKFVAAAKRVREALSWMPTRVNWVNVLDIAPDENSATGVKIQSYYSIPGSWVNCERVEDQVAFIRQAAQFDIGLRDTMCRQFRACLTELQPEEWDPKAFHVVNNRSEANEHTSARTIHRINLAYMPEEEAVDMMRKLLGFQFYGLPAWAKKPEDMKFLYENRMLNFHWTTEMFAGPLWLAVRDLESRVGDSPAHFSTLIDMLMDTNMNESMDMKTIVEMVEAITA